MPREDITTPRVRQSEVHSDATKIEQRRPVDDADDRDEGDVILCDPAVADKEYQAELAFMEEPVTIRLEPSADPNAISVFAVWCNGKSAETFSNGRWNEVGWLPVGQVITVKRKILEIIVRTKLDTVSTQILNPDSEHPHNTVKRFTSAVHSFSVIEDRSKRGAAWLTEMRRRNF